MNGTKNVPKNIEAKLSGDLMITLSISLQFKVFFT